MKHSEFAVWMKGYIDLCPVTTLTQKKLYIIRNHLHLVKAVEGRLTEPLEKIHTLTEAGLQAKDSNSFDAVKHELFHEVNCLLPS